MRCLRTPGIFLLTALFFIVGCENLPFFATKKMYKGPDMPATTTKQPVLEVSGTVIAKVNNMPVTLEELNEQIEGVNKLADEQNRPTDRIDTRDQKITYLKNELIRQKLFYQEALKRGMDKKPTVKRAIDNLRTTIIITELLNEELNKVQVSSSEIQDYYNSYKEQFREPEQREVREILVSTEDEARQVLRSYYSGEEFGSLARQYSKAETANKGGYVGYIQWEANLPRCRKFYETAYSPSLEVGNVSNIFSCPEGWYIIKLEAKKEGKLRTASEMWDEIKNYLTFVKQQQQLESLVNKLTSDATIVVEENKIY